MAGLFGLIQQDKAPADRTVDRSTKHLSRDGHGIRSTRHEGAVFSWHGADLCAHEDDDLVILLDGWVSFPTRGKGHGGPGVGGASMVGEAWRIWGIDLVRYIDGEFSVAVYEKASGVLHLITDPVASRRIFWARAPGRIAFSTSVSALLALPWVDRTLQRDHLAEYLAFRVVHAPRTLLRDLSKMPPGHRLRADGEGTSLTAWHEPTYAAPGTATPREQDVVPELTAAVEASVRRHLDDSRRVGVYLSGGVGSTSLVAAARAASRPLETFTVIFTEEPYPESPFAGRVAGLLGMTHHTVSVGSKEVAEHFDEAVRVMGHPVGNVSVVLQLLLAKAASEHVDVVLTGDGTDQLFGGNMLTEPAAALRRAATFHRLPAPARAAFLRALGVAGRGDSVRLPPLELALDRGFGGVRLFDRRQRRTLLLDESLARPAVREEVLRPFYDAVETDPLNTVLHAFHQSSLVSDTLPRVESAAAAARLDVGFPLLDREVSRLAQVLPGTFKVRGVGRGGDLPTRWLLRTALSGALPAALVNRPDRGLPRPLDDWLTGAGRLFMEERFSSLREDPLELFHTTALEALKRGLGKQPGATQRMWALFMLDAWLRHHRVT